MSTDDNTPETVAPGDGERIAKVLSRAGVASRRDAERLILEGRVSVNGETITSPAVNVTDKDRLAVDGQEVGAPEATRLWLYHKPAGLVTTEADEEGRPTVFESLPDDMPRVMSVGRLDLTSEGLLLLTNDGEVKRRLELPSTGWTRRYRVRINGRPQDADFAPLRQGITVDGMEYQPMEVEIDRQQGSNAWLTVTLREGKNREIRRVMEELGFSVNRLIRVSYGPFQLGDLPQGDVEEVRPKIVRDQLGLGAPAPVTRSRKKPAPGEMPVSDDEPEERPGRDRLAPRLPAGAVKRSIKPRVPKTRGDEGGAEEAPRPRAARAPRRDDAPGPFAKSRTWMRADDPRPPRDGEAQGEGREERRPRSEGYRSHREEGDRPRRFGDRDDRPPRREGGDRPARPYKPRGDAFGEEGSERPRKSRWSRDDRAERPPREGGGERPARAWQPRRDSGADRPPREGDDRPARAYKPRREGDDSRPARPYKPRAEGDRPPRPYKPSRPARAGGDEDRPPRAYKPRTPREGGDDRAPRPYKPRREGGEGDRPARPYMPRAAREEGDRPFRAPRGDRPEGDRPGRAGAGGPRKGPPRDGGFKGGKPPRRG